ncbi:hypothetical protein Gasu2_10130 [Galdieria sulphuraria]|nr:hypothetical protein Gasu2_10130 [Galdieria sulphuraria]
MKLKSRGLFEQKRTLISVLACFLTGIYSAPFSLLLFGIPATTVGAPTNLVGLFSVIISAFIELLFGRNWTGTQIFVYFCFICCVLWDGYDDIKPDSTKESIEPMMGIERASESEENTDNEEILETLSSLHSWDEKFLKTMQSEGNGESIDISKGDDKGG